MIITLDHAAVRSTIEEIQRGAAVLGDERVAIAHEVETLMRSWTGIAATAFAEGWEEWQRGALQVLDGLLAMGELIEAAHDDLSSRDVESQARLDLIADRITSRLG